jgi:ATP-dependent Clp protease adaptor protein ClpS
MLQRIRGHTSTVKAPVEITRSSDGSQFERMAQVVLYNDDVNSFDHVIRCIQQIFGHNRQMAEKIAMDAHNTGRTIAEVEGHADAIRHKEQLVSYGLTAEVEGI